MSLSISWDENTIRGSLTPYWKTVESHGQSSLSDLHCPTIGNVRHTIPHFQARCPNQHLCYLDVPVEHLNGSQERTKTHGDFSLEKCRRNPSISLAVVVMQETRQYEARRIIAWVNVCVKSGDQTLNGNDAHKSLQVIVVQIQKKTILVHLTSFQKKMEFFPEGLAFCRAKAWKLININKLHFPTEILAMAKDLVGCFAPSSKSTCWIGIILPFQGKQEEGQARKQQITFQA